MLRDLWCSKLSNWMAHSKETPEPLRSTFGDVRTRKSILYACSMLSIGGFNKKWKTQSQGPIEQKNYNLTKSIYFSSSRPDRQSCPVFSLLTPVPLPRSVLDTMIRRKSLIFIHGRLVYRYQDQDTTASCCMLVSRCRQYVRLPHVSTQRLSYLRQRRFLLTLAIETSW